MRNEVVPLVLNQLDGFVDKRERVLNGRTPLTFAIQEHLCRARYFLEQGVPQVSLFHINAAHLLMEAGGILKPQQYDKILQECDDQVPLAPRSDEP